MAVRVGINGFGRIGRQSLKALIERAPDVEVVAVNDLVDADDERPPVQARLDLRRLPRRRSSHTATLDHHRRPRDQGPPGEGPGRRCRGATSASTSSSSRPASSPTPTKAGAHIDAGAKKVIISAPAKGEDITIVLGVNEDKYDPASHHIISNASCTTNCLAPAAKVVHDLLGIERGLMNTIHSYTNDQRILDVAHKDPRRARARRPEHHPDDDRRGQGARPRHPGPQGQVRRLQPARPDPDGQRRRLHRRRRARRRRVEELNDAFRTAAAGPLKGILGVSRRAARVDRTSGATRRSSIIDAESTMVLGGTMVKVIAWYDNEWGYSCRVADLIALRRRPRLPVAA